MRTSRLVSLKGATRIFSRVFSSSSTRLTRRRRTHLTLGISSRSSTDHAASSASAIASHEGSDMVPRIGILFESIG